MDEIVDTQSETTAEGVAVPDVEATETPEADPKPKGDWHRHRELKAAREEAQSLKAQAEALKEYQDKYTRLSESAKSNPLSVLEELGIDLDDAYRAKVAGSEEDTLERKLIKQLSERDAKLSEIEAKLTAQEEAALNQQRQKHEASFAAKISEQSSTYRYMDSVGPEHYIPLAWQAEELLCKHYGNGYQPSWDEIAREVEASLKHDAQRYAKALGHPKAQPSSPATGGIKPPKTIGASHLSVVHDADDPRQRAILALRELRARRGLGVAVGGGAARQSPMGWWIATPWEN